MMKKLLVLALIAVAREATAEDAKCVRERAAMIETIRAYTRSDAGLLGPQGIYRRASWRPWGKRNAIGSSLAVLARSHTRTGRYLSAKTRQYHSPT